MERPAQTLQTVYNWNLEDQTVYELNWEDHIAKIWRLKSMMALEIALGLTYAHVAGILHRNLRSANVFLTDDGHPKIFGFIK
jgi:serine/threonine protein kinase